MDNLISSLRIFIPDEGLTRVIGGLISLVFVVSLVIVLGRRALAYREVRFLRDAAQRVRGSDSATLTAYLDGQVETRASPTTRRFAALTRYEMQPGLVEAAEALGAQQEREFEASLLWPHHAIGVLVLLGLLGTLVGLSSTVGTLKPFLDTLQIRRVEEIEKIVQQIGLVMGAMRNAFACTLDGVAASVLLGWATRACAAHYQRRVLLPADELSLRELVPVYSGKKGMDVVAATLTTAQTALANFTHVLNDLEGAANRQIESANQMGEQTRHAITRQIDAADQMSRQMNDATLNLKNSSQALSELAGEAGNWLVRIETAAQTSAQVIAQSHDKTLALLEHLRQQAQATQNLIEQGNVAVVNTAEQARRAMEQFAGEASQAVREQAQHLQEAIDRSRQTLDQVAQQSAVASTMLQQRIEGFGQRALGVLGQMAARSDESLTQIQHDSQAELATMEAVRASLTDATAALRDLIFAAEAAFRDAVAEAQESAVRETVAEVHKAVSDNSREAA